MIFMKIRTKLELILFAAVAIGLATGLMLFFATQKINATIESARTATQIHSEIFNLGALTSDYLLRRNERSKTQWQIEYGKISKIIEAPSFASQTDPNLFSQIQKNHKEVGDLFAKITADPPLPAAVGTELEGQLSIKLQTISNIATQIVDTNLKNHDAIHRQVDSLIIFIFTFVIFSGIFLLIWFRKTIIRRLTELHEGTDIVARGDLNYRLAIENHDEFDQVSTSFNKMADELKKTYATIENDKLRDEAILASIGEGVIATDEKGAVLFANGTLAKILGLKVRDIFGKDFAKIVKYQNEDGREIPVEKRPINIAFKTGKTVSVSMADNFYYVRQDGVKFPVAITVTPIILNSKIIGTIGIIHDVTAEKEVDKRKSEFIALASHQLRTPISIIRWNLELLEKEAGLSPKGKTFLKDAYTGTLRTIKLVGDLLNVAKIEEHRAKFNPKPTDICEIVQKVVEAAKFEAEKRNIDVKIVKPKDLPKINVDIEAFRDVVEALLLNAVRYNKENGSVLIEIKKIDSNAAIKIADTGIGIPEAEQPRIYQKFFRASNATKIDNSGTGLGLYIVKSYVEAWGGSIRFESREGKGTTFFVTLPAPEIH